MQFNILVDKPDVSVSEEIAISECVQLLVKNLTVESLKTLADKSKKKGINDKIKKYKNLV